MVCVVERVSLLLFVLRLSPLLLLIDRLEFLTYCKRVILFFFRIIFCVFVFVCVRVCGLIYFFEKRNWSEAIIYGEMPDKASIVSIGSNKGLCTRASLFLRADFIQTETFVEFVQ